MIILFLLADDKVRFYSRFCETKESELQFVGFMVIAGS